MLGQALSFAEKDDCYQALKLARRVMRHEEEVLGLAPVPPARQVAPLLFELVLYLGRKLYGDRHPGPPPRGVII